MSLALAAMSAGIATSLTAMLWPHGRAAPFSLYYLAVLAAVLRGGARAGGLTIALSAVAVDYFFLEPLHAFSLDPSGLLACTLFAAVATVMVTLVVRHGTRRRAHELEMERVTALYAAHSQINQAIVRLTARDEIFQRVCEVLTEQGRFDMAWIGWHDVSAGTLVPVATRGDRHGYLQRVEIRADGGGPTATAFREGRTFVCDDVLADPRMKLWREALEQSGFGSSAALPIRMKGAVQGTLNVYAREPRFFRDAEVALLVEAAADISFALDVRAREEERLGAEAAAEGERRFADALVETVPGILYLYDEKGRFLRWSRSFETASGYSSEEIARMGPLEFFSAEERPLVQRRIATVFEEGEASVEASLVAKNGVATPYFFNGRRISFDGATCLVGMGIDMTEQERAEAALKASEERHRTTLDNILEGCQLLGFDWRYLYLNDSANQHNRRPASELLGRTMPEAWPGIEGTPVFALLRRGMEERARLHEEVEFSFADGDKGWFDIRTQPVPEGLLVLSVDITERRKAETALRELNESLERKVAERTVALDAARERAESADRVKSAFLATMSHELRTPLNSIIGFTGIILKEMAGPLNAEQSKQLSMVQASSRHLLELINDVLDISKIEAGQLEVRFQPVDLLSAVERSTASVRPLAEKKGLGLRVVAPVALPPVESDRRRVEQILLNLLNNALKFTERGEVTVTADVVTGAGSSGDAQAAARIQVADTGVGIKPEDLATLFQPFRQVDSSLQRQHEGTGLGLAICRRLAGLLGGEVHAHSVWGEGSVFTLTIPIERRLGAVRD